MFLPVPRSRSWSVRPPSCPRCLQPPTSSPPAFWWYPGSAPEPVESGGWGCCVPVRRTCLDKQPAVPKIQTVIGLLFWFSACSWVWNSKLNTSQSWIKRNKSEKLNSKTFQMLPLILFYHMISSFTCDALQTLYNLIIIY